MHVLPTWWIPASSQSCPSSANYSALGFLAVSLQKFRSLPTALHFLTRAVALVLLKQLQKSFTHVWGLFYLYYITVWVLSLLHLRVPVFSEIQALHAHAQSCLSYVLKEGRWVNFMCHPICFYPNSSYHSAVLSLLLACDSFYILPCFLSFYKKKEILIASVSSWPAARPDNFWSEF